MTSKGLCGCIGILCSPKMATNAFENVCALKSKVKKEKKEEKRKNRWKQNTEINL